MHLDDLIMALSSIYKTLEKILTVEALARMHGRYVQAD